MIKNMPKVGDWINYNEKAYKVLEVNTHPTRSTPPPGVVWLYVLDMNDKARRLTIYYDQDTEQSSLPLIIFSEAMTK